MSTVFSRIIAREIPANIVYQDDRVTAFHDINPSAPVHILIVPNKEIRSMNEATPEDEGVLGHMMVVAAQIAREQDIAENGYRLIINTNAHAGQEIFHLHLHLLGGRPLGPMVQRRES